VSQHCPDAVAAIRALRERGKRLLFVSNKPLKPRDAYAAKLTRLGIPTGPDEVITSAFILGYHMAHCRGWWPEKFPGDLHQKLTTSQ
jgi:ribonucleotide monophosphatase NagD (HAD superfamily)